MNKYHLVTFVTIENRRQIHKRILFSGDDPITYLDGYQSAGQLCYPMAISPLTKTQFKKMKTTFPTIEVVSI